jgi:hypothetical protein
MYYGTITVTTTLGKRFAAIEHLKKLAKLSSEKFGIIPLVAWYVCC